MDVIFDMIFVNILENLGNFPLHFKTNDLFNLKDIKSKSKMRALSFSLNPLAPITGLTVLIPVRHHLYQQSTLTRGGTKLQVVVHESWLYL